MIQTKRDRRALVINALGRLFMDPAEDPFSSIDGEIADLPLGRGIDAIVVDFHCEAPSEKQVAGHF